MWSTYHGTQRPLRSKGADRISPLDDLREALARALLGEEESVALFVLDRLQLAHDVVGALLEPPVARGRPHEADGREVVAGDMAGEVVAVAVPALVRLRFRGQARPLAVEREHPVGLEMEQVLRVQVLRVFERPAGEPHGGERQRPRDVGPRGRDLGRVTGAAKQEGDGPRSTRTAPTWRLMRPFYHHVAAVSGP